MIYRNNHFYNDGKTAYFIWRVIALLSAAAGLCFLLFYRFSESYVPIGDDDGSYDSRTENSHVIPDSEEGFYYQFLSESGKKVYSEILESAKHFHTKTQLSARADIDTVYNVVSSLSYDYPQYYWLSSGIEELYSAGENVTSIAYRYRGNEYKTYNYMIDRVKSVINEMPDGTDYEKVKFLYEWLAENTVYDDTNSELKQSADSVLIDGVSVCAGYARAFKVLCDAAGVECVVVEGVVTNSTYQREGHLWNLVRIGSDYYWVDPTWGDPNTSGFIPFPVNYDYLCVSDRYMNLDHDAASVIKYGDSGNLNIEYPVCNEDSYDYYVLNGSYFEYYDLNSVGEYISEKVKEGDQSIKIKFGHEEELDKAVNELIEGSKIYDYISDPVNDIHNNYSYNTGIQYTLGIFIE